MVNPVEIKQQITATFDDVSERYDENIFFSISAQAMLEFLPVEGVKTILDLSTGTGMIAMKLAEKYPHALIEAVDLSQRMLSQAQDKAAKNGVSNIRFVQGDAENLPYSDSTFDIVTCGYGLFFYPQMKSTYQALCKMIKPGGMFIFSSFTSDAFRPQATVFLERLKKDYNIEAPMAAVEKLESTQQIEKLALSSHPQAVKVKHHPIRYPITTTQWWALLNSAGYKQLLNKLSHDDLIQFKKNHLAEIDSLFAGKQLELNADSYFGLVYL